MRPNNSVVLEGTRELFRNNSLNTLASALPALAAEQPAAINGFLDAYYSPKRQAAFLPSDAAFVAANAASLSNQTIAAVRNPFDAS